MNFKSRKDVLFYGIIYGIALFIITMAILEINKNGFERYGIWTYIFFIAVIGFIIWTLNSTKYVLTNTYLNYQSGFITGKIQIDSIHTIINGKTMWSGLKPATARNGLIIKYNTYDEIYISPKTNETFVSEILKLNKILKF
ncbi:PH domain-containing protein [Flavobacterium sp.]|uniref:PH domain-containing protein n=1 Tax=Flavobacterium sp. TaxID=239 RepID=UPI0025E6DCF9|nr:PH domain-containing protein [Flavobacterium sp.]